MKKTKILDFSSFCSRILPILLPFSNFFLLCNEYCIEFLFVRLFDRPQMKKDKKILIFSLICLCILCFLTFFEFFAICYALYRTLVRQTFVPTRHLDDDSKEVAKILNRVRNVLGEKHGLQWNVSSITRPTETGTSQSVDNDSLFQGDIRLTVEQAQQLYEKEVSQIRRLRKSKRKKRKFTSDPTLYWNPNEPIYYDISSKYNATERRLITDALNFWQKLTCLKFRLKPRLSRGNGLVFIKHTGCSSNVGRNPYNEPQTIIISGDSRSKCMSTGVIAHELAHALGLWHETSRPDRDLYVKINIENVNPMSWDQFHKENPSEIDYHGVPYDYGSIMHYSGKAFATRGYSMRTKIAGYQYTIGQREQLSFYDVKLMNKVYCSNKCPFEIKCRNKGYQHFLDCSRCICPDGFSGRYCGEIEAGTNCGGPVPLSEGESTTIKSPVLKPYQNYRECYWLLIADKYEKIVIRFTRLKNLEFDFVRAVCMDYVEIRNGSDLSLTGMRFCGSLLPRYEIRSERNEMMVLFRNMFNLRAQFQIEARTTKT